MSQHVYVIKLSSSFNLLTMSISSVTPGPVLLNTTLIYSKELKKDTVKILHGTYAMSQWLGIVYGNKVGVFTETGKAQDISIHLYLIFSMDFLWAENLNIMIVYPEDGLMDTLFQRMGLFEILCDRLYISSCRISAGLRSYKSTYASD